MLTQKVSHLFYRLVLRLIFCRLAHNYEEHHTAAEDVYAARIGPLHVEVNECFVLDHADASISLQARWSRGLATAGIKVCIGEDQIRRPGFFYHCWTV